MKTAREEGTRYVLTVKELRVLDADGNLAITLNTDDDLPGITLFGKLESSCVHSRTRAWVQ